MEFYNNVVFIPKYHQINISIKDNKVILTDQWDPLIDFMDIIDNELVEKNRKIVINSTKS